MSRIIMLLMMLAFAPISRAETYLNFLSEEVMPLHDKLFETNFVVSQDPPMCEKNKLIRGFFFSKYRAIYLCLENLLEDPRLGNIDGSGKDKDARLQLSRTLTHEAVHAAQWCRGREDWTLFDRDATKGFGGFGDSALDEASEYRGNRKSEYEAYLLENDPDLVHDLFSIYCGHDRDYHLDLDNAFSK